MEEYTTQLDGTIDLVVVEDVLSAIRVGCTIPTASLLGSSCNLTKAASIVRSTGRDNPCIAVWLDGDKAGVKGRVKVANMLHKVGAEIRFIRTEKDPKMYSYREIIEFLNDRS